MVKPPTSRLRGQGKEWGRVPTEQRNSREGAESNVPENAWINEAVSGSQESQGLRILLFHCCSMFEHFEHMKSRGDEISQILC